MECLIKEQVKEVLVGIVNPRGIVVTTQWVNPDSELLLYNNVLVLKVVFEYALIDATNKKGVC